MPFNPPIIDLNSVFFGYEPASHYLFASLSEDVCDAWASRFAITPSLLPSPNPRQRVSLREARKLHPELTISGFDRFVLSLVTPALISESLSESDTEIQCFYACANE